MRHALLLSLATGAAAHGVITLPAGRNGGTLAVAGKTLGGFSASWYTDQITIPGKATNCAANMRTVTYGGCDGFMNTRPWMAPGTAPVLSPCGTCQNCGGTAGTDGRTLPPKERAVWQAGTQVKVAWAIQNNHGGGYAYRLCPAGNELTEDCFRGGHLQFAGAESVVHWSNGTEVSIPLLTTTQGTTPPGSMWARNPIPTTEGTAPFDAPCPGCIGEGTPFSVVDKVAVPAGVAPGDYVLSWRWDCEGSTQVWLNCADVTITSP